MDTQTQSTEETTAPTSDNGGGKKKSLPIGIIVAVLVVVGAIAFIFLNPSDSTTDTSAVVATVDGVEITQQNVDDRITRNKEALEAQGTNLSDPTVLGQLEDQVVNQIINETLALAEARNIDLSVSSSEIDTQYDAISGRFDSEEAFKAEMDKNRFTEETLRKNIERELLIQKYIDQITSSQNIEVTEEEIIVLYDQLVAQSAEGAEIPELDDVRSQIEDQLRNQKLSQIVNDSLISLKDNAVIVITEVE